MQVVSCLYSAAIFLLFAANFISISYSSEVVAPKMVTRIKDMSELWLGDRFAHSVEPPGTQLDKLYGNIKAIVPVKSTYQTGLHMAGACNLDYPYNGCERNHEGLCFQPNNTKSRARLLFNKFFTDHYVDERVKKYDTKKINMNEQGCLYHMLLNCMHLPKSNLTNMSVENDYKAKFFPLVMTALRRRQLDLLIDVPGSATALRIPTSMGHGKNETHT